MKTSDVIAKSLLDIKAVGFALKTPITFKSGMVSPVYVDNRIFPFFPEHWHKVITGFADVIKKNNLDFDVIAGIETAGIPHSAALGFFLGKPSVFVRKQTKDHGTKKRVEGGVVAGKKVLLIEDHVTTGSSSLSGVAALRSEGAEVSDCLAITSYDFPESRAQFLQAHVSLHVLTTFSDILAQAEQQHILTNADKKRVERWFVDPHGWRP